MTDLAAIYATLFAGDGYGEGHYWRPVWPLILSRLASGGSFLDVGCGRGSSIPAAREAGIRAEGCDFAPCHPWITRASLPALPYASGSWDVVGCFDVLEHIPESDVPATCAELRRVAAKHLIVSVSWCSASRTINGEYVELHLTRRPVAWWQEQFRCPSHVICLPDQPEDRAYLDVEIGA